jgi:CheY-like chemotaxis protein
MQDSVEIRTDRGEAGFGDPAGDRASGQEAAMTEHEAAKILVVDDNEAGRCLKSHALKDRGYVLFEAGTGKGGLALLEAEHPDLVLLDVKLPDMSGLDVCRRIKTDHPAIVVLQTSATFVRPADRASALAGGADSFLMEPIEPEELVAAVGALLRMRQAERQLREANQELKRRVRNRTRELIEAKDRLAVEMEHRAKAEEALRHAQKLDAIGRLTGGIAHDFNNLLTVVLGNLSLMEMNLRKPAPFAVDKLMKLVGSGRKAVQDCEQLTRQLLAFARRDPLRAETVDLTLTLAEFEGFLRGILGEKVDLEVTLASGLWPLQLDARQFETTILNLAINARDAMPEWGRLQIESANRELVRPLPPVSGDTFRPEEIPAGDYVQVSVRDTGEGMSADIMALAFEPFFTTKDVGKGSGLGLSQVHGFVKQSGGFIAIASTPGRGTIVELYFRRSQAGATVAMADHETAGELPEGQETILVVEDDARVRDAVLGMLESLGYRVLYASNGAEALDVLEEGEEVELLFSDIVMPRGMTGVELAREARRRRPSLKILLTSGFAGGRSGREPPTTPHTGEFPFLPKPYTVSDLARRLRETFRVSAAAMPR